MQAGARTRAAYPGHGGSARLHPAAARVECASKLRRAHGGCAKARAATPPPLRSRAGPMGWHGSGQRGISARWQSFVFAFILLRGLLAGLRRFLTRLAFGR